MSKTGGGPLVETLMEWLPEDGINGIMEALRRNRGRVGFIRVRYEEAAAFMACGRAKQTGLLGACLATSGPGGAQLLNGPLARGTADAGGIARTVLSDKVRELI